MINKKNLWFLTLFSLILVLSVYYVTMPSELLLTNTGYIQTSKEENNEAKDVIIQESDMITALKVESEEELLEQLDALKLILNDDKKSTQEKNDAFDKMKDLNANKTKEEELEKLIETDLKIKTFIKIKESQIKVVVDSATHDTALANSIMRKIQEKFETKMYITVQFKG